MRGRSTLLMRAEPGVRRACAIAYASAARAFLGATRALGRALIATLEGLETVLLSPVGRDRVHATATFALIFLFAVTSVDFLVNGGPEFGAPARAAQPQRVVHASVNRASAASDARAVEAIPTELADTLAEATEANVIAVSHNIGEPLMRVPPAAQDEGLIEIGAHPDLTLAGEVSAEAAETAQPRKGSAAGPGEKAT